MEQLDKTLEYPKPSVWTWLYIPWLAAMCLFALFGAILVFGTQYKFEGFVLLSVAMAMMLIWVQVIGPRSKRTVWEQAPKRKGKNPVYRQPKRT